MLDFHCSWVCQDLSTCLSLWLQHTKLVLHLQICKSTTHLICIKSQSREHVLNNLRLALDDFKFKFAEGNITALFKFSGISSIKSKGVIPWLSIGFLSSIFPRRKLYISIWPFWAAECSGVQPSLSFGFMSIECWRIKSHTAKWPLCAAKCKGVHPWSSLNYQVCKY